ncbi:porin family protein [Rhodocytophaga rosea]|uniref:Porin family protein n=1 Tax=Rhodocytophaga rosea TaxID=2704465 RepID=A0A6C0GK82_9BACT|nr:outer membrane beta-barrel protein [Rhodocytophaga rosea]QHT68040.1 porin family protein [Rhodocytophaga rosea]
MKKVLILLAVVLSFGAAKGQTEQGNFLLGGSFGASFNNRKVETPTSNPNQTVITETRSTGITFTPKVGFFITDGMAIGLDADINSTTSKNKDNNVKSTSSYFTVGPFARYYFPVNLFIEGGAGIGSGKNAAYAETRVFKYSVGAGFAAFLNDNVALEPMVSYSGLNFTNSKNTDFKTRNSGLQVSLGLQIYL